MDNHSSQYEVVIVGGSYAGLSAALALGRSLRKVLIIDDGKPCNRQTPHSHNFLTWDGATPAEIGQAAREQVEKYPTVSWLHERVADIDGADGNFKVITQSGQEFSSKKIIFTTGVRDIIPPIPGMAESWGISVVHCPYCHGYEFRDQPTGLLANGTIAVQFSRMVRNLTDKLTIFTNGPATFSDEDKAALLSFQIELNEKPVSEIVHVNGYINTVRFSDGSEAALNALYARIPFEQHCRIPEQQGCKLDDHGYITTTDMQMTTVPGIYAAGDCTSPFRSVSGAVAAGGRAGAMVNHELVNESFPLPTAKH